MESKAITRQSKRKMNKDTETVEISPYMVEIDDNNEDFLDNSFLMSLVLSGTI